MSFVHHLTPSAASTSPELASTAGPRQSLHMQQLLHCQHVTTTTTTTATQLCYYYQGSHSNDKIKIQDFFNTLTLSYLTFGHAPVQRWDRISSAQCAAPNVTEGHISLLEVLANRIRDIGQTLLSSSSSSRWDPKMEYLSCIWAGHVPRKWKVVSSSSPHAGQSGSFRSFITLKCLLSVFNTIKTRKTHRCT